MIDKELIKQEIERRISANSSKNDISEGALALESLLDFIDSLPEEPGCEVNCTAKSEDLEEAATKWNETASFQPFYMQLDCNGNPCEVKQDITTHKESFKAGAEWQKQQMKETLQTEYEKGRYDMREEMMKDAVDATIFSELKGSNGSLFQAKTERFRMNSAKISDRIKVIPIKTEQQ